MSDRLAPTVTVLTCTFDRGEELERLYLSLLEQTYQDFEWLVIDDGSTDDTDERVRRWADVAPFRIRYTWDVNRGKQAALNRGFEQARGRYTAMVDADDWYLPNALTRLIEIWESIPAGEREGFANVEALCRHPDGRLVGTGYPAPVLDSDNLEIRLVHGVRGDTRGMYRTDVLKAHPFPQDLGWFIPEALVWNRIGARYRTRYVNEVIGCTDYARGRFSQSGRKVYTGAPKAMALVQRELLELDRPLPLRARLRAARALTRYSLHDGEGPLRQLRSAPSKRLFLATLPVAVGLWIRDRIEERGYRRHGATDTRSRVLEARSGR